MTDVVHRLAALLSLSIVALGCGGVAESLSPVCEPPPDAPPTSASPRLERTWQIATHNAYWVNHGVGDPFASGTQERFADQIAVDGVRSLEIDVHRDDAHPHAFRVYHTNPGNSLCDSLDLCLAEIAAIDAMMPARHPLTLVVELKEISGSNFDRDHTIDDLDAAFRRAFGDRLLTPADLFARCDAAPLCVSDLGACVEALGFPALDELRGRVLVAVLGNWDGLGAQATRDWVDYAIAGDVRERAGLPMASSWQLDWSKLAVGAARLVTQDELDSAFRASVTMQVEDTKDPRLAPFLARRGLVRIDGANTTADQRARLALGAELLQTDTPWVRAGGVDLARPLGSLDGVDVHPEPGVRLALDAATGGARVFAFDEHGARRARWESLVVSGASGEPSGCLRATSVDGTSSFSVCRTKIAADRSADAPGSPDAEQAVIVVTACRGGACTDARASSRDDDAVGDLVALELAPHGDHGVCARASTAATASVDLRPAWRHVGDPACFSDPLARQGLARNEATSEAPTRVWFVGASHDGAPLAAADLASVFAEPDGAAPVPSPALLVDASTR